MKNFGKSMRAIWIKLEKSRFQQALKMDKLMNVLMRESKESKLPVSYLKGQIVILDRFMKDIAELAQKNKVPLRGFDISLVYSNERLN